MRIGIKRGITAAFGLAVACVGAWLPITPTFPEPLDYAVMVVGFAVIGASLWPGDARKRWAGKGDNPLREDTRG